MQNVHVNLGDRSYDIHIGDRVSWNWGSGTGTGTVTERFYLAKTLWSTRTITNEDGTLREEAFPEIRVLYDPELRKLALSTFLLALLFYIGYNNFL